MNMEWNDQQGFVEVQQRSRRSEGNFSEQDIQKVNRVKSPQH